MQEMTVALYLTFLNVAKWVFLHIKNRY